MDYSQNIGLENKTKALEDLHTTGDVLSRLIDSMLETEDTKHLHEVIKTMLIITDMELKLSKQIYGY